ncbi:MAG: hypothetical protein RIS86_1736 [Planctomycetota bacterium]|jgi:pyridoxal phosphate enzyme (YggS family)
MPGTKSTSSRSAKGARREAPAADDAKPADARTLRERYEDVRARVAAAAVRSGRRAEDVLLVAVTKYAEIEDIRELVQLGHLDLGENRVQQLEQRAQMIDEFNQRRRDRGAGEVPDVRWHMIGTLQRNKVKKALPLVRLVHSVDSLRLAEELQEHAEERNRALGDDAPPVDVLVEVNVAGEKSKHGVAPAAARHLVDMIDTMLALRPRGLMCMAPNTGSLDDARRVFTRCKEIFDEIRALRSDIAGDRFDILSMGMSGDYEVAIECGSNLVRVGSAIFGEPAEGAEAAEGEGDETDASTH